MIKSMTGFGRNEVAIEDQKITIEMKAVNHRYCDVNIRMPRKFNYFEAPIRNYIKKYASRGKIDIFITYEGGAQAEHCVKYNEGIAKEYFWYVMKMSQEYGLESGLTASGLSRYPDVFVLEEQSMNEEELWSCLEQCLQGACEKFVQTRIQEGEHLKKDIVEKLDYMLTLVDQIEKRYPVLMKEYREKLTAKVTELLSEQSMDENRIATEVILYADKICVDEETVRLKSHIQSMKKTLSDGENIGRKLDFIAQEMNREANTILSKANDLEVSDYAIDLKTEIEKVREQIQNIE